MDNLAGDTEALKTNFFFRGFFNRRGFYNMSALTPGKYDKSRFVKHPGARVWLPGSELFASGPNGSPELKKSGRAVLDQRMSALVRYLPNNPIMVEGYSTYGAPDQQYLLSRQRAIVVRDYLVEEFHLDPKFVGFMPLGSYPPAKAGKQTFDGVCLVLVVQKRRHGLF
ncbi:MAG TPA: OmpA family protein [Candidatus Acidoferrum sp.]|nr:OmpA family protein [Candidatus Acidoferrum sp.]